MKALLAIIMVLLIGCSGFAQAQQGPTPTLTSVEKVEEYLNRESAVYEIDRIRQKTADSSRQGETSATDDEVISALIRRIDELEARTKKLERSVFDSSLLGMRGSLESRIYELEQEVGIGFGRSSYRSLESRVEYLEQQVGGYSGLSGLESLESRVSALERKEDSRSFDIYPRDCQCSDRGW